MNSNNREIHLKDFPKDKVVIFLEDKFRKKLIDNAINMFGREELARSLNIRKLDTITRWKEAKINRGKNWITPQGIPLDKLDILLKLLNVDLDVVEEHVTSYKSRGKSLQIKNPNLPISESPVLFRVMAHLIGDGSANENNVSYFKNFNKAVYDEFANDLKEVFGGIELSLNKDNVVFPITVRHILSSFYNINFGTFDSNIPKRLFHLSPKYAGAFIHGFFDDEGNVDTSCIRFYSFNKRVLQDIIRLLIMKFPKIASITDLKDRKKKTGIEYYFSINSAGLENFHKLIGCTHSSKKEKLKFYIKRKQKGWNHRSKGNTKLMILESLSSTPKTIYELTNELLVSRETVRAHLFGYHSERKRNTKGLIEQGLVEIKCFGKYNSVVLGLKNS